jgi:RNA polymerase sigma-70 factor, ECF subfamily
VFNMPSQNDIEVEDVLVAKAQAGNPEAFAALLNRYDNQVYRIALKITDSHEDAEDVLQESLLNAYLHLAAFRGESRFSTWLIRIVAHQAMSKVRRRKSRREVSLDNPIETDDDLQLSRDVEDESDDPEAQFLRTELQRIVLQTIDSLEPGLRVVLVMRELGMLSMEDMAGALDVSVPVAKSRLFRARQKLRERVQQRLERRAPLNRFRAACYAC